MKESDIGLAALPQEDGQVKLRPVVGAIGRRKREDCETDLKSPFH